MIIIGEKINTSAKIAREAVENLNADFIQEIAKKQTEAGADFLDINCGTFIDSEVEKMKWIIETVQKVAETPLCIDSPNSEVIEEGLKVNKNGKPIINSITAESNRWSSILPLVIEYKTSVVALCMNDDGIPDEPAKRFSIAHSMANEMAQKGISLSDIFFDPMVKPISTDSNSGRLTLETMRLIKKEIPDAHLICGLSNISFGLPVRKLLNQGFLCGAIFSGLDSAIIDPMDKKIMSLVYAAEALAGKDEYCMEYISKYREEKLEV